MVLKPTDRTERVPNGGYAILDKNNKLVAYSKRNKPIIKDNSTFDWIRRDYVR